MTIKKQVILNLIQDLQRLPLSFLNNLRGRCQIKFGMTFLFSNSGFTLIELLVVVLIIGILAAVAVPQYQKAVYKSRFATLQPLVSSLANAAEIYYIANGEYPTQFDVLDIELPEQPSSADTAPNEDGSFNVYFPWGQCTLMNNKFNKFISCAKNNIGYTQFFSRSPHNSADRVCSALNGDTTAYNTCKAVTGNEPYYTSADNNAFAFN